MNKEYQNKIEDIVIILEIVFACEIKWWYDYETDKFIITLQEDNISFKYSVSTTVLSKESPLKLANNIKRYYTRRVNNGQTHNTINRSL